MSRVADSTERPSERGRPRVLLAYPYALVRQALRVLLQVSGMDVVAEAADGQEAVATIERVWPDVVVMDAAMPLLDGVEAARRIRDRFPSARVLLIVDGGAAEAKSMLAAGAAGCLSRDADAAELRRAVQAVHRGETYLGGGLPAAPPSVRPAGGPGPPGDLFAEPLTPREREVLQLVADGLGNQDIARRLCVSVKTVEAHKAHIMRKLQLRGPAELIKYAIRAGLVGPGEALTAR